VLPLDTLEVMKSVPHQSQLMLYAMVALWVCC